MLAVLFPRRPTPWFLLTAALVATCVILLLAPSLQQQWAGIHQAMDNLRGALAPDTGGKAACRSGLLGTIQRALAGRTLAFW